MFMGIVFGFLIAFFIVSGLILFNGITGAVIGNPNYISYSIIIFLSSLSSIMIILAYFKNKIE